MINQQELVLKIISGQLKPGGSVMELGCGDCGLLNRIITETNPGRVLGIDLRQSANFPSNAEFIKTNLETIDLTEQFDLIIMNHVFEHVKNPVNLLLKLKKLLKKNGALLLIIPNRYGWNNEADVYIPEHGKHYFLYDAKHIKYILEKVGYACRPYNLYFDRTKNPIVRILAQIFKIQNPELILTAYVDVDSE